MTDFWDEFDENDEVVSYGYGPTSSISRAAAPPPYNASPAPQKTTPYASPRVLPVGSSLPASFTDSQLSAFSSRSSTVPSSVQALPLNLPPGMPQGSPARKPVHAQTSESLAGSAYDQYMEQYRRGRGSTRSLTMPSDEVARQDFVLNSRGAVPPPVTSSSHDRTTPPRSSPTIPAASVAKSASPMRQRRGSNGAPPKPAFWIRTSRRSQSPDMVNRILHDQQSYGQPSQSANQTVAHNDTATPKLSMPEPNTVRFSGYESPELDDSPRRPRNVRWASVLNSGVSMFKDWTSSSRRGSMSSYSSNGMPKKSSMRQPGGPRGPPPFPPGPGLGPDMTLFMLEDRFIGFLRWVPFLGFMADIVDAVSSPHAPLFRHVVVFIVFCICMWLSYHVLALAQAVLAVLRAICSPVIIISQAIFGGAR